MSATSSLWPVRGRKQFWKLIFVVTYRNSGTRGNVKFMTGSDPFCVLCYLHIPSPKSDAHFRVTYNCKVGKCTAHYNPVIFKYPTEE